MPLAEMYRTMLEATNPATWETNRQKQLMGEYELESKRRAMEAEQQLRQLYSSGGPVSSQDVMAISPDLGIKLQQAGNQALLQQLQAEELMRKKQEADAKTYAQYVGPIADTYFDDIRSNMPQEQALQKFRSAIGSAQAELDQKHNIKPQADFTQFEPKQILDRTTGLGVPSRHYKSLEEEEKTRLGIQQKQAPGPSDRYFIGPDGLPHPMPSQYLQPGGGQPPVQSPIQPYPVFEFEGKTYKGPEFMRMTIGEKDPAKKQRMEAIMDAGFKQQQEGTLTSPDVVEKPKTKQELEVETAAEKVKAEAGAKEEIQQGKMEAAFDKQHLIDLINESTPGGVAEYGTKATQFATLSTPWSRADKMLKIDSAALTQSIPRFEGPQSDKDTAAYREAAGDLANPALPRKDRIAAVEEMDRLRKKYAVKHGKKETSSEAIQGRRKAAIDMLNKGKINEAKFKQLWDMP